MSLTGLTVFFALVMPLFGRGHFLVSPMGNHMSNTKFNGNKSYNFAFSKKLSDINIIAAILVPAAIGILVVMFGIYLEAQGESELLREGGLLAVDIYKASLQINPVHSLSEFIILSFVGRLPSFGGNVMGIGFTIIVIGSAVGSSLVLIARLKHKKFA